MGKEQDKVEFDRKRQETKKDFPKLPPMYFEHIKICEQKLQNAKDAEKCCEDHIAELTSKGKDRTQGCKVEKKLLKKCNQRIKDCEKALVEAKNRK